MREKTYIEDNSSTHLYKNYPRTSELGREGSVTGGREGVCLDSGERDTILGMGGPAPPGKGEGQQLVPDSGGGET